MDIELGSQVAVFSEPRRAPCRAREMGIPISSSSAHAEAHHLSFLREVVEQAPFHIIDERPHGEFHDPILRISPMHELDAATFPIVGSDFFDITEIRERIDIGIRDDDEVSASPAITSKRPPFGYAGFPPPGDYPVSSVPGSESDVDGIDEHFDNFFWIYRVRAL